MNVPTNFMHKAYVYSLANPTTYYVNQFNNKNNFFAHYHSTYSFLLSFFLSLLSIDTAPEIWRQTNGKVDGFIMASGTGGTLAGISAFLKVLYTVIYLPRSYGCSYNLYSYQEKNPNLQAYLIDPPGSGLFHLVKHGVMFDQYAPFIYPILPLFTFFSYRQDTLTIEKLGPRSFYEGIGINRQTENFAKVNFIL